MLSWRWNIMKDILVVIDMQNDFIHGPLKAEGGEEIVPFVVDEIRKRDAFDVIFTKDTHHDDYLSTNEGRHLPVVHCIENTSGWELVDEIRAVTRDSCIIKKPTFSSLILIDELRKRVRSKEDIITLVGVCSDICVISNAVLVKAFFRENPIRVLKDGVKGVTAKKNQKALDIMESMQIDIL